MCSRVCRMVSVVTFQRQVTWDIGVGNIIMGSQYETIAPLGLAYDQAK